VSFYEEEHQKMYYTKNKTKKINKKIKKKIKNTLTVLSLLENRSCVEFLIELPNPKIFDMQHKPQNIETYSQSQCV
jgi:hypothetical protein